nr:recombinase family protein [Gluconacetobacter dulcium]
MAESLDRVSRDQADVATLFKRLQFAGVTIVTLAEGEISELHGGLKGTMNALFLKDLAMKTHRGLRGRVEAGIHPNVAAIFKHKVERLAETLNHPEDRQEASEAIRALIEKIVLHPGKGRGEMHATLHGELGNLLDFAASRDQGAKNTNTPGARASGVSVSGIAGGAQSAAPADAGS